MYARSNVFDGVLAHKGVGEIAISGIVPQVDGESSKRGFDGSVWHGKGFRAVKPSDASQHEVEHGEVSLHVEDESIQ